MTDTFDDTDTDDWPEWPESDLDVDDDAFALAIARGREADDSA